MNKNEETKEQQIEGFYLWLKRRSEQSDARVAPLIIKTYLENMDRIMNMEWSEKK